MNKLINKINFLKMYMHLIFINHYNSRQKEKIHFLEYKKINIMKFVIKKNLAI